MKAASYRDLILWQKAMELSYLVYEVTRAFPAEERYGLTSQMRRCAVSIPSNIAEGRYRSSAKEFKQFLHIAFGSGAELETQVEIATHEKYLSAADRERVEAILTEVMKLLNTFISGLS